MDLTIRRVTQVDLETGEDLNGVVAGIKPKQKSPFEAYFTLDQAVLLAIANKVNHEQIRVLMALLAEFNYENYLQVAQMDRLETLKMQQANVSRAVKT